MQISSKERRKKHKFHERIEVKAEILLKNYRKNTNSIKKFMELIRFSSKDHGKNVKVVKLLQKKTCISSKDCGGGANFVYVLWKKWQFHYRIMIKSWISSRDRNKTRIHPRLAMKMKTISQNVNYMDFIRGLLKNTNFIKGSWWKCEVCNKNANLVSGKAEFCQRIVQKALILSKDHGKTQISQNDRDKNKNFITES